MEQFWKAFAPTFAEHPVAAIDELRRNLDRADESRTRVEDAMFEFREVRHVGRPLEVREVVRLPERRVIDVFHRVRQLDRPDEVISLERLALETDERELVSFRVPDREPEVVVRAAEGAALVGSSSALARDLAEFRAAVRRASHVVQLDGVVNNSRIVVREDEIVAETAVAVVAGIVTDSDGEPVEVGAHGQCRRERECGKGVD